MAAKKKAQPMKPPGKAPKGAVSYKSAPPVVDPSKGPSTPMVKPLKGGGPVTPGNC